MKPSKQKRGIVSLLVIAGIVTILTMAQYTYNLIVQFNSPITESTNPLSDFLAGFAVGISWVSFLMVAIIIYNIYNNLKTGKIFTCKLIYFVQMFGLTQIVSGACIMISNGGVSYTESYSAVIGLLVIVFAQIFKIGLKMQVQEELTI